MQKSVKKMMRTERLHRTTIVTSIAFTTTLFALLFLWGALKPALNGVSVLDSSEQLHRFAKGAYSHALLQYDTAVDTGMLFSVTRTSSSGYNIMIGNAYLELPGKETTHQTDYKVWKLSGDGYAVYLCTTKRFENSGELYVSTLPDNLANSLLNDLEPNNPNVFAAYLSDSPMSLIIIPCVAIALVWFAVLVNQLSIWDKHTKLARQLAALGDYDTMVNQLNQQLQDPLLSSSDCTVLRDYVLLRAVYNRPSKGLCYTIASLQSIENLTITKDDDDSGDYTCAFTIKGYAKPFKIITDADTATKLEQLKKTIIHA